ncbi:MAG: YebC/PmpR family DNA-binding transcriptional regulator [Bacteroidales bacterium]|jgi:YebC/PmpR family DNA-binding regulatory protein|nr:YebC/PmpR family DNA-binding transcriptional regulator [Bacteroidales bacterium]
MSGHNKWSTIKRKKGANDAKRSKMFSKIIKEITVAVKEGGYDPDGNPRLRMAIANAKGVSMPKDNIQRAINKGKDKDSANFTEVSYEGYAPHGIAVFVECTTDNLQRTIANVRAAFNKYNGSLGKNGSLAFLFDRKAIFTLNAVDVNEEFELEMIDAGAEDYDVEDGVVTITTSFEDFGNMMSKLEELNIEPTSAEVVRIPNNTEKVSIDEARSVLKLVDVLEDDDDVVNVFHNMEIPEELLDEM